MKFKAIIITCVLCLSTAALSGSQITDSRTFKKAFRVNNRTTLDVSNKYGNIHLSHVSGDSITIRVEVTASSEDETRLNKLMSDVDISMTMTGETVRAQTIFGKNVITLFESFKSLTKSIINYGSRLQVDYYIECPHSTILRIVNSYGDVYIGEETPELTLTLSNGSLDADVIKNALSMEMTFCKASIREVGKGRINVSFGEMNLKEAKDLNLVTRSAKIRIDEAGELDIDSKRDVLTIGSVKVITGETYFSDITTDNLSKEISLLSKYGNLSFESINEDFSLINITSSYADIDLSMTERSSYNLEIHHTNAFVSLPGVTPAPQETVISSENKVYLTTARVGSSPDRARIRIDATKGEIRLLQK